jgi:hypothetical protein
VFCADRVHAAASKALQAHIAVYPVHSRSYIPDLYHIHHGQSFDPTNKLKGRSLCSVNAFQSRGFCVVFALTSLAGLWAVWSIQLSLQGSWLITASPQVAPAFLLALVSAVSVTVSAAAIGLEKKASCVYHCGSVCYWQSDIDAALAKGYALYKSGSTLGMCTYNTLDHEKTIWLSHSNALCSS